MNVQSGESFAYMVFCVYDVILKASIDKVRQQWVTRKDLNSQVVFCDAEGSEILSTQYSRQSNQKEKKIQQCQTVSVAAMSIS